MNTFRELAMNLMEGTYDLHTHNHPSHFNRALDAFEVLREADKYGMAGIMLKSHYECTADAATLTNRYAGTKAKAYGSLVLNWPAGGLNPYAIESAIEMGIRYIWMPTLDAVNSMSFGRMPIEFFDRPGITVFDEQGKLLPVIYDIFEVLRKHDAYLATGHVAPEESIVLCRAGIESGVNMILTHPDWNRTVVPFDLQKEMAGVGVLVEKVWMNVSEGDISRKGMAESIKGLGAENVFMVTDRGQAGHELPPAAMLDFIEEMLRQGISAQDIKTMTIDNPHRIVEF